VWQVVGLWLERRRGIVGARLHARLVLWFGLTAMAPTIIISAFSVLFVIFGLDIFFSDQVRQATSDAVYVGEAYLEEHLKNVVHATGTIAVNIRRRGSVDLDSLDYAELMTVQGNAVQLDAAAIVDNKGNVIVSAKLKFPVEGPLGIPPEKFAAASGNDPVILS